VAGVKSGSVEMEHSNTYKIPTVATTQVCKTTKFLNTATNRETRNQPITSNQASSKITKYLKGKHKIVLIGESHARGSASKLEGKLQN
jgi:hypothetical protein